MMAKCVGCGKTWNVSIKALIPKGGYMCPHCTSKQRVGEPLPNQHKPKGAAEHAKL